jgi:hypothetical protein
MLFIDHGFRSTARSIYDATLLAYPILPLENDPTTDEISHIRELNLSLILSFHLLLIRRLTGFWINKLSSLSSYPVLPLKCDPTVMKTLQADPRSRMIVELQLASDLTRHPNSAIGSCVLLVSQPQSLIFEGIRSDGPD